MYAESAYSLFKELNETLEIAQKVKKVRICVVEIEL